MSTRALIGRLTAEGEIHGRYHHSDGYLDGLGATLFGLVTGTIESPFTKNIPPDLTSEAELKIVVDRVAKYLIDDHKAGWSSINDANWDTAAGYVEYHHEPNILADPEAWDAARKAQGPRCYCHGDRNEKPSPIVKCTCNKTPNPTKAPKCDPLFLEYAYGLCEGGMLVLVHFDTGLREAKPIRSDSNYRSPIYVHKPIGFVSWNENFNTEILEARHEQLYEETKTQIGVG